MFKNMFKKWWNRVLASNYKNHYLYKDSISMLEVEKIAFKSFLKGIVVGRELERKK